MKFEKFLEGKKEFRAAFLGGSITEGVGCSTTSKRYTSQIVERLNRRLPEINFIEINAGVGGTPSALGLFRLDYEVLSKNIEELLYNKEKSNIIEDNLSNMQIKGSASKIYDLILEITR